MRVALSLAAATALAFGTAAAPAASQPTLSASVLHLAKRCAPNVSPLTMSDIVSVESRNHRLAVNVNGDYRLPRQPATEQEAIETVSWLARHGYNFDVGYAQVNSSNFKRLGVTGASLLDGCTNLRASATVLTECYARAVKNVGEGQAALARALSCYNTGSPTRGFHNGYVAKVTARAQVLNVPALMPDAASAPPSKPAAKNKPDAPDSRPDLGTPDAFSHADPGAFSTNEAGAGNDKKDSGGARDASVLNSPKTVGGTIRGKQSEEDHDPSS